MAKGTHPNVFQIGKELLDHLLKAFVPNKLQAKHLKERIPNRTNKLATPENMVKIPPSEKECNKTN
jgi:hypothetical protein